MPQPVPAQAFSESVTVTGTAIAGEALPVSRLRRVHDRGSQMVEVLHKRAEDVLDYYLDLRQWLEPGETVVAAEAVLATATTPPLAITGVQFADTGVVVWVAAGADGRQYDIRVKVTTSEGRIKSIPWRMAVSGVDGALVASVWPPLSRVVVGVGPEGDPVPPADGGAFAQILIELSRASEAPVDVAWETEAGTAHPGQHYEAGAGTLTFAPGEMVRSFAVKLLGRAAGDDRVRTLSCRIVSSDALVGAARAVIVIDTLGVDDPAEIPTLTVLTGQETIPAKVGRIPVNILVQALAGAVQAGADGKTPEFRATSTHVQWRHEGEGGDAWRDLYSLTDLQGLPGEPGDDGREVEISASGTHIRWRMQGDVPWLNLIALADIEGAPGTPGSPGVDGREVALRVDGGYIQWQYAGAGAWNNLIAVAALTGTPGTPGTPGEDGADGKSVELQASATHIQWRLAGGTVWLDLVALSGLRGAPGTDGRNIELQKTASHIQWRLAGGAWADLVALAVLTGAPGNPGTPGDDGREIELQKSATHLQWRYAGSQTWVNVIALADITGPRGDAGTSFTVNATGTLAGRAAYNGEDDGFAYLDTENGNLYLRQTATAGVWSQPIPFGKGEVGDPGAPGADGHEIQLQKSATHLQWRYAGEASWVNLVPLSDITGAPGTPGTPGEDGREVALRVDGGYIQWQYAGAGAWNNLIAVANLEGTDGEAGADGREVELQKTATHIQWRLALGVWANLVALADLAGPPGSDATGNVVGPGGATLDGEFALFNGTTGRFLKSGGVTLAALTASMSGKFTLPVGGTAGQYINGLGALVAFPAIPAAQVSADWNAASGPAQILNRPSTYPPSAHAHAIGDVTNLSTQLAAKAPLASPALTGTPTVPTAAAGTASTQAASTKFVADAIAALIASAPGALDTLDELAAAMGDDPNFAATMTAALGGKLAKASNLSDLTDVAAARTALQLGSAALSAAAAFASAAQGVKADSAVQPAALGAYVLASALSAVATSGSYNDLSNRPTIPAAIAIAAAAAVRAGTDTTSAMGVKATWDAMAPVALTDAATIALDLASGVGSFTVTLGGNRTLGNPTNAKPGQKFNVTVSRASAETLSFGAAYVAMGPITLPASGKRFKVVGEVMSASETHIMIVGEP